MKVVYCANCGTCLPVLRKAIPGYGRVLDVVEYHECPPEPIEIKLYPIMDSQHGEDHEHNKFVQKINELQPARLPNTSDLKDRRSLEHTKSESSTSAPPSLLRHIKSTKESSD